MRRIHLKEQQIQDYANQLTELKSSIPAKSNLVDPAINLIFMKLKAELKATKAKLEDTQNELTAWKFTPDSNTGKRLMAKCRLLYQENEELGKIVSNGRLAKLESDLALHRNMCDELKRSQSDVEGIIQDLDVDVEGLTSTIILLQQKLKTSDEKILLLESEKESAADETQDQNPETDEPAAKKPCLEIEAN
jgi:pre-mRNA-splicing regulator WTAP